MRTSLSFRKLRNLIRNHKYIETEYKNENKSYIEKKFEYDPTLNKVPEPKWIKDKNLKIHNRIPRGAIKNFTTNYNSARSNYINGNIKKFKMNYKTKKDKNYILEFEDGSFPKEIKSYKGWYRVGRKRIMLKDIIKDTKLRGVTIQYERTTNRFFMFYPVEISWRPVKCEIQTNQRSSFISLDTGIRTFETGYSSDHILDIGTGASERIKLIFDRIDKYNSKRDKILQLKKVSSKRKNKIRKKIKIRINRLYRKIKNLVSELHWKTCNYLVKNYDNILLPEFRVADMIKGKLSRKVKRLMNIFSFYKFRQKLEFKSMQYRVNLKIVDESYTSKTCTNCGHLNQKLGSKKDFKCPNCGIEIDRDINGARNILIKNYKEIELN